MHPDAPIPLRAAALGTGYLRVPPAVLDGFPSLGGAELKTLLILCRCQLHAGRGKDRPFPLSTAEMAFVSMTCSLNVAELLGLRWKWVNLTDQPVIVETEVLHPFTLAVRQNYYRGHFGSVKAAARRRDVPLSRSSVDALMRFQEKAGFSSAEDLVFCSKNGTPLIERNLTRRYLKPAGKRLGMPWLSWHVFRHSHSTFGEHIGMALSDRQAQMGHRDVEMTLHYTHSDLERRRAAIESIAEKLVASVNCTEDRPILTLNDTKEEVSTGAK